MPGRGRKEGDAGMLIAPENIVYDAAAEDFEQAIRAAGDLLVRSKAATDGYVDAMVDTARTMKYIVLAPGIAMPHARPEAGALGNGLSLVRLKKEVCFGHPENDPVRLVFGLVAVSEESHLDTMEQLAELLEDQSAMDRLFQAHSREEMVRVVGEFSDRQGV